MKRVLLPLWIIGAVVYAVSTILLTNAVDLVGGDDGPESIPNDASAVSGAPPNVSRVESLEGPPTQLEPLVARPAADNPHAISLEEPASEALVEALSPSSFPPEEQPLAPDELAQAPSDPVVNDAGPELLKVGSAASIRNSPSASADVIGTAYAGAEVRVASRDFGWTQIVDPSSGNKGWIDSTVLVPLTPAIGTASTEDTMNDPPLAQGFEIPDENGLSEGIEPKPSVKAKKHGSKRYSGRRKFSVRFGLRRFR